MALSQVFSFVARLLKYILTFVPSTIYDTVISRNLTIYSYERWATLVNAFPKPKGRNLRILDIGVGTAVPLYEVWDRLPLQVDVCGIDIDKSYIQKSQRLFKNIILAGGSRKIDLQYLNFYEMSPEKYGTFDLIIFSSSFMLMPQRDKALQIAQQLLNKEGRIQFILTLQEASKKNSVFARVAEYVKPRIKYVTTIDFGQITYEDDFERLLKKGNMETLYKERLLKSGNIPTKLFRVFLYETKLCK